MFVWLGKDFSNKVGSDKRYYCRDRLIRAESTTKTPLAPRSPYCAYSLRLCWEKGLSVRQAAQSCGVGRTTINEYLDRAKTANLSWPLPEDLDETSLENLLFPSSIPLDTVRRNMPPFDYMNKELKRRHMTLQRLWEEYRENNPEGYQYSVSFR